MEPPPSIHHQEIRVGQGYVAGDVDAQPSEEPRTRGRGEEEEVGPRLWRPGGVRETGESFWPENSFCGPPVSVQIWAVARKNREAFLHKTDAA
jgi:hypothetical protein